MKRFALALATALLLAACGDPEPAPQTAAEVVPALGDRLERVDELVVDRRWTAARTELRAIIVAADRARTAGDLDATAADRVVASAQRLLAALPAPPKPTPTPTQAAPAGDGDDDEGDDEKDEKGSGKGDDRGGSKGKGKKDD